METKVQDKSTQLIAVLLNHFGKNMNLARIKYLHGFIARSKERITMKKIAIALVFIFGITIAAQHNTATGQEKVFTQKEVELMMQVQELERQMAGMRKDFELQENKWKERADQLVFNVLK
jgi:hypothetical protein